MNESEAAWRRRFRATSIGFPQWARGAPERAIYTSNAGGKLEWYAWDRGDNSHRQLTDRPDGTGTASLDPSGEWVWFFDDDKGNELGRWARLSFDGERHESTPFPVAYSTGLALGEAVVVASSGVGGRFTVDVLHDGDDDARTVYEHHEAVSVGGISRDDVLFVVAHSEHGDSRNRALRVLDLAGEAVAELWDGPGRGLAPSGWSRVHGDRRLIVSHERQEVARPEIWEPETGAVHEYEIDLPGEVSSSWYPDASALLVTHLWQGRTELYRFDLASGALDRIETDPGVIFGARIRPDGELWYHISRSSAPPEVRCGAEVLRPPGEPAPGGVAYRDVHVGTVHGFIAEPAGARPHPTILRVHGGPSGLDADSFSPPVQAWVDHGYAVVLVNYRGSAGYGKEWRDAIVGRPGVRELDDIVAVRDHVVAEGIADPQRIVLGGASWGGYLTLLGLARHPQKWSIGISGVPLADLAAHYSQQSEPLQAYWRSLFGGTPDELTEVLREISPIEVADQVEAPLFILVGDNDPRCPLGQVMNYVERLRELGKEPELYRYDAGHGSMVVDEQIHQTELQLDFAARHLGTPTPL